MKRKTFRNLLAKKWRHDCVRPLWKWNLFYLSSFFFTFDTASVRLCDMLPVYIARQFSACDPTQFSRDKRHWIVCVLDDMLCILLTNRNFLHLNLSDNPSILLAPGVSCPVQHFDKIILTTLWRVGVSLKLMYCLSLYAWPSVLSSMFVTSKLITCFYIISFVMQPTKRIYPTALLKFFLVMSHSCGGLSVPIVSIGLMLIFDWLSQVAELFYAFYGV